MEISIPACAALAGNCIGFAIFASLREDWSLHYCPIHENFVFLRKRFALVLVLDCPFSITRTRTIGLRRQPRYASVAGYNRPTCANLAIQPAGGQTAQCLMVFHRPRDGVTTGSVGVIFHRPDSEARGVPPNAHPRR